MKIEPTRKVSFQDKEQLVARMIDNGQLQEAERICQNLLINGNDSARFLHLYGLLALRKKQPAVAVEYLQKSIAKNDSDPLAHLRLGIALFMTGQHDEAMASYRKTLQLNPGNASAHFNLANVYFGKNAWQEAARYYTQAIQCKPDFVAAYNNLGVIQKEHEQYAEARRNLEKAVEIDPGYADAYYNLGSLWTRLGNLEKAEEYFRRVYELDPQHQDARACLCSILDLKGQPEAAFALMAPLVAGDRPLTHLAAMNYAGLCANAGKYEEAIDVLQSYKSGRNLDLMELKGVHFALGSVYDKMQRYDEAFENFSMGNEIREKIFPGSQEPFAEGKKVIAAFTEHRELQSSDNESELPVFIVGMPRSGTSLTEQILSSHSRVAGGGELTIIREIVRSLPSMLKDNRSVHECLTGLSTEMLDYLADRYLEKIRELCREEGIVRVTDKMPGNFTVLGFIRLLFPRARIIHCIRHPLDTCLSIYMNDFRTGHEYRNNLQDLGEYYCLYREMMDLWKNTMQIGMFELQYEDLVKDQEGASRALVEYCGLEWDDSCLGLHESRRLVRTASFEQVPEPIYTDSIHRWRNYEQHLQPLIRMFEQKKLV